MLHSWLLKLWVSHRVQVNISVYFAYLYFLVKHLAINPCSSGLSSCFPGDGLPFMGEECEDTEESEKPLNTEINFCHRAVISPSTLFKQLSNFVTFSFKGFTL